jgi:hypothetical protein
MIVETSEFFLNKIKSFSNEDKLKIMNFINHIKVNAFQDLVGRRKHSREVPEGTKDMQEKIDKANLHNLWHYHIGIPNYDTSGGIGDYTSEYVLHYTVKSRKVLIVDINNHPPFELPHNDNLK